MVTRILLVESDTVDYGRLCSDLEELGKPLELVRAATAREGLDRLGRANFDVLLLDLERPGGAGAETVRRFRERDARLPIVVLTAAGDDRAALHALEAGAQDCVVKEEVCGAELWCAIRIAMERQRLERGPLAPDDSPPVLAFAGFELHEERRELLRGGEPIPLNPRPFDLLVRLLRDRHRMVSKHELLDRVWAGVHVSDTALSSALKELRHALGDDGTHQRLIRTLRGHGYRFVAAVEERRDAPAERVRGSPRDEPVPRAPRDESPAAGVQGPAAAFPAHLARAIA
jgi:DNA-binding response OmpR family regulator